MVHPTEMVVTRFVYDDYIWEEGGSKYSHYGDKLIPATVPLAALVQGFSPGILMHFGVIVTFST